MPVSLPILRANEDNGPIINEAANGRDSVVCLPSHHVQLVWMIRNMLFATSPVGFMQNLSHLSLNFADFRSLGEPLHVFGDFRTLGETSTHPPVSLP